MDDKLITESVGKLVEAAAEELSSGISSMIEATVILSYELKQTKKEVEQLKACFNDDLK